MYLQIINSLQSLTSACGLLLSVILTQASEPKWCCSICVFKLESTFEKCLILPSFVRKDGLCLVAAVV